MTSTRHYLTTLGIVAIYVAHTRDGWRRVGITHDLARSQSYWSRRGGSVIDAYWTKHRASAAAIRKAIGGRRGDLLTENIRETAANLGIPITAHAVVLARIAEVVREVDAAIEVAQRNGELKRFNKQFKQRRLAGESTTYRVARAALRKTLFEKSVAQARTGQQIENNS